MQQTEKLAFSVSETATLLGVSERVIRTAIAQKEIPSLRLGAKRILIPRRSLEIYLAGSSS
ncbi:MAG: helix-turn-helix domain-containing protein [Candidatus Desulforudis sp.]|nr:helix-turn-helix domain-containing protein [Desulforudis sp.]